ncbi:MFS transporter [Paenibacillus protaetiae]|uniref:MFS transporter n=2 Tax=Paenibacillus protaetiae TaxID=2509456 RepID=A0A4P6F014_9BACL|nr:MFS transporter [Paenibacillus protaetiae]
MLLITAILFLENFVRGGVLVSFLPIYGEKTLGLSLDIIGVAITAHYLTDTALKIAIGYLLDRLSVRLVVQAGLLISFAGLFALQFATVPWLFITASAVYGIGISPIWIVCLTSVSDQSSRGGQMGYWYSIWLVGLGAGPVICNVLLDYSSSFTYSLLIALYLLSWMLSLFLKNRQAPAIRRIPFRKQLLVLQNRLRKMKLLLPGMVLQTMGASMLVPVLPKFAETQLGFTGLQYSVLLTLGGICAVAGLVPMGKLSDKHGRKKIFLLLGFSFLALCLVLLAIRPPIWYCFIIAMALGIAYSAVLPAWNALLGTYVPPKQEGMGWGILSTVEGIGVMVGPVVGGLIGSSSGTPAVVWASAALFALIALYYLPQKLK